MRISERIADLGIAEIVLLKADLERRTKQFGLRILSLTSRMPRNRTSDVIGRQLLKAGTSIGANYREANRAESRKDFIHKIALVEKEAAETLYWLELCAEAGLANLAELESLRKEAEELLAIFTRVGKTSKARLRPASPQSAIRNPQSNGSAVVNPQSEIRNPNS